MNPMMRGHLLFEEKTKDPGKESSPFLRPFRGVQSASDFVRYIVSLSPANIYVDIIFNISQVINNQYNTS